VSFVLFVVNSLWHPRLLYKPLLLAGCGARLEAEQRLSLLRTLGGVVNSKSATTPPKHAERGSGVE